MSIKSLLAAPKHGAFTDVALLVVRVVAGVAFAMHGWPKIQNPTGWMGSEGFAPGFLQALAAVAEFGGGIAWALGLLTPLASIGIACTMGVAIWLHAVKNGDPFVSMGGPSYELAAVYFAIALLLLAAGPGRLSLDRAVFGSR